MTILSETELALIDELVLHYRETELVRADRLAGALLRLVADKKLTPHTHSLKARAKDPEHLRDKLLRKMHKCKRDGTLFSISKENLFEKINDLAGVRILHLHTAQFPAIDATLKELLRSEEYQIIEGPKARIWDTEYADIFTSYGIETESNPRLYTSVHYIIATGNREVRTAEIQVRTLAEELWGEVDHTINYPHPTALLACQEQIKVLARVTSSCTRLVDSIFLARGHEGQAAE
jgi:putative GTP pyrophosphokinase